MMAVWETPEEEENTQDETTLMFESDIESLDDAETVDGRTLDEIIPLPATEGSEALELAPCDLTFETQGEAAAQLSSS